MMGDKGRSRDSSDRENWDIIFNGMIKMLRTQQDQLESLVKERKILEDKIKMQQERWVSDGRLYEDHLAQVKREIEMLEIVRLVETAKWNVLVGLKDRDESLCKLKLGHAEDELNDLIAWFHLLAENPNDVPLKDSTNTDKKSAENETSNSKAVDHKTLECEIRRLKLEYEKLASERNSEVSTLLRENGFVWNQYKHMESELTGKLKSKDNEVKQANEKILSLISNEEKLQSFNKEKDETIVRLKAKVAEMKEDANKKDKEISRLSGELESLRKSRNSSVTPVLRRCRMDKNVKMDRSNVVVKKELSGAIIPVLVKQTEKGSKSLKRKTMKDTPNSETPKLFTSSFKVPKLKIPSPQVIQLS